VTMPAVLDKLPPAGTRDQDVILNAFLDVVSAKGLSLYPAQEEAILEVLAGKHVVLATPTGSGKSLVALGMHFKAMSEGTTSVYTAPIKALVSEKFFSLCQDFGAAYVGMMTGDATINRDAPILCCTAEILSNLSLRDEDVKRITHVVMDEFHYYGDKERGIAWQLPLLTMHDAQFLLMSATLGDTRAIEESLKRETGREVVEVFRAERPVPLEFEWRETPIHETIEELVASHRAPVYVVNFTQRECAEQAQALTSANFTSKETKQKIADALKDFKFDTPYGKDVQRYVRHGLGLHHAGLLPKYRLMVEQLAQQGLLKVICGTDTLGVGVNIPIRTVLFAKLAKYDGESTGILTARDFKQIAGRAGRKGFDDKGWVIAQAPEHVIENKRAEERFVTGQTKKKPQKKQPEAGFVGWDKNTFERLRDKPPESMTSRFSVTFGLMVQLLATPGGYRRLVDLIARSHENDGQKAKHRQRARVLFQALVAAGLVEVRGKDVRVSADLQQDFSVHTTLALWLIDALSMLDPASETYALDVLTCVESILESPKQILWKQEDKAKTRRMAEMKAEGMEYEERMAELEKITHPKPLADFVYDTFNAFAAKHPWVGGDAIRPKSIAREMVETFATFHEYVREYQLERSEGLLLRYLSDAYKTLVQTVPEHRKDDGVLDVQGYFRSLLARVDSSLVEEWEAMIDPEAAKKPLALDQPRVVDVAANPKTFAARVRAELHRLVKALASEDWEEAAALVRAPFDFPTAMKAFTEAHGRLAFTPRARQPTTTIMEQEAPRRWRVRQVLVDEADENDWMIEGLIDLEGRGSPSEPLVEVVRIGT
jgi:superfamily II RNA helicase